MQNWMHWCSTFSVANDKDKVWVIALFSGRRPKRAVNATQLASYCVEVAGLPFWLFEESYHTVGDLAETIALLLPQTVNEETVASEPLHYYIEGLKGIEKESEEVRKGFVLDAWRDMTGGERFVFNKLITGSFRIGVSQALMVNALAKTVNLPSSEIAHRISGNWDPATILFDELLSAHGATTDFSKPTRFSSPMLLKRM
jgi:DNA ligase-1